MQISGYVPVECLNVANAGLYSWRYAKYGQNVLFPERAKSAYFRSASSDQQPVAT